MTAAVCFIAWVLADPPPGDAYRLPPVKELTSGRMFSQRYQRHLEDRLEWQPYGRRELREALDEARWLYQVWDCAEGAHPDWSCGPEQKATYLRRLRLLIGRDGYYRDGLPPCVPTWRFHELR